MKVHALLALAQTWGAPVAGLFTGAAHSPRWRRLARRLRQAIPLTLCLSVTGIAPAADDAQAPATSPAANAKPAAEKPPPAPLPTLAEILLAAERTDALEHDVRKRFGDRRALQAAADNIAAIEESFAAAAQEVPAQASERVQALALIDLSMEIRSYADRLKIIIDALDARARALDNDLDHIGATQRQWATRIEAARQRNAPVDLLKRIEAVPPRLDALAREVTARRNAILVVLDRVTRLRGQMSNVLTEATERRDRLIESLATTQVEPLWRISPRPDTTEFARTWLVAEWTQLHGYVARHWSILALTAGITFLLGYGAMWSGRRTLAATRSADDEIAMAQRLCSRPVLASLALTLTVLLWSAPEAPIVFIIATLTLLFLTCALLAVIALGHQAILSLCTLAVIVIVHWFQVGFDALPFSGRLILIVECAVMAIVLWIDLRRGRMAAHRARLLPPQAVVPLVWVAIVLLVAAIAADVFGSLGLARLLRDGVLRTLGFAVTINVLMQIMHSLILALILSRPGQWSLIVQHRLSSIRSATRIVLRLAGAAAWLIGSLFSFKALKFLEWVDDFVSDAKIEIGAVTISAEAVFLSAGVLLATWILVKVIRVVLDVELLPRMSLTSGTSFVISATTRYLLVVAGTILAMAALGLDFSKVTLLISAIGVGIGFGLQNVVNNFVSGLMLLGERVVNIGDTIQVGNLTGVVRRIGVRSTTVRTTQGAEVIVPNGDLTSKEVVNFTLSDRHRRLDIIVGVAYRSDPHRIAELLIDAAKSCPEVLSVPAPVAAFIGFGDSALNFRLQAWIGNYEGGVAAETALRVAILARFNEAGIEIPFPQQDINIRSAPGMAAPNSA